MTHTAKHTPGPWTARKAPERNAYAWDVEGAQGTVPTIARMALVDRASEVEANAHLIAAAPAMYEALAKLRLEAIHYRNTGVGVQFLNKAIAQAEHAINQVWGEGNHDTKREG
jgi:hypothetical protein